MKRVIIKCIFQPPGISNTEQPGSFWSYDLVEEIVIKNETNQLFIVARKMFKLCA